MKTILVTGSNGLLGQKITEAALALGNVQLIATSKGANRFPAQEGYIYQTMDVLQKDEVFRTLKTYRPQTVIHTAAITNVDTCHTEREAAEQLNVKAVATLANACQQYGVHLIHLSTDFVFDGTKGPYTEEDPVCPISYYGQTKVKAEELLKQAPCKWTIVRTILVYGLCYNMSRSNIVLWAKNALEKGQPIRVVNDQVRTPTLVEDLAKACLLIAEKESTGIFNISGKEQMTIAQLVKKVAAHWHLNTDLITEISSEVLNQEAKRPLRTGFILEKAISQLNYQPHTFAEGLALLEKQLNGKKTNFWKN